MDIMTKVVVLVVVGLIILITLLGEFARRSGHRPSLKSSPSEKEILR